MANDLPAISVSRPYLAAVLNLLIIVAGFSALFGVEVRNFPMLIALRSRCVQIFLAAHLRLLMPKSPVLSKEL